METDHLVECPYNKSHLIHPLRMPYHLMKCRKNHPTIDLAVCPFNAIHEVQRAELKYHMLNCPNRVLLQREVSFDAMLRSVNSTSPPFKKGYTDLPRYKDSTVDELDEQENWDEDVNPRRVMRNSRFTDENYQRRDVSSSLRRPTGHGLTAQLSAAVSKASQTSLQNAFNSNGFFLGRGRSRLALSPRHDASTSAHFLQPGIPTMSVRLGLSAFAQAGRGQFLTHQ